MTEREPWYRYTGVDLAELAYADKDADRLDIVLAALESVTDAEFAAIARKDGYVRLYVDVESLRGAVHQAEAILERGGMDYLSPSNPVYRLARAYLAALDPEDTAT